MHKVSLDKRGPVPLYHQLKTILHDRIREGHWKPGEQLPTEDRLVAQFGVSKATVRQALRDLSEAGLVRREQGRGTFVSNSKIQFGPRQLSSFTEEMRDSGLHAESRVLEKQMVPASAEIAAKLQVAEGTGLFLLRRLRLAGGEPMGLQTVHIPSAFVPGIADVDFGAASLYETLEKRFGLAPDHASQRHFATAVDGNTAGLLKVSVGAPALGGERLTFLRGGQPLELTYSIMRGDRYQIQLSLVRAPER
ncbi:MAG: GntR family transcriptional regulator [Bryobacteraceae bacterium]|jgi:GntR family transcriptional regulator